MELTKYLLHTKCSTNNWRTVNGGLGQLVAGVVILTRTPVSQSNPKQSRISTPQNLARSISTKGNDGVLSLSRSPWRQLCACLLHPIHGPGGLVWKDTLFGRWRWTFLAALNNYSSPFLESLLALEYTLVQTHLSFYLLSLLFLH